MLPAPGKYSIRTKGTDLLFRICFEPLLKWGLIREKFSSLVTDALRGEWLETQGYKVQMMEFIDIEHTPKNILIRAVKTNKAATERTADSLMNSLGIKPEIFN